jgi:general secretion pathway protein J
LSARASLAGSAGFTLLELLVALAIAAILVLAQVAPFQRAIDSRDRAEAALERTSAARVTLQRLSEELAGAVPLAGTRFTVADRTFDLPASELRFATTGARRLREGPQDPIERIAYRLDPPARGERGGRLVKEQIPSVAPAGTPPLEAVVLEDVAAFRVRVLPRSGQEWIETWQAADGSASESLPQAVEIELALADGSADPIPFHVAVTLPMRRRS